MWTINNDILRVVLCLGSVLMRLHLLLLVTGCTYNQILEQTQCAEVTGDRTESDLRSVSALGFCSTKWHTHALHHSSSAHLTEQNNILFTTNSFKTACFLYFSVHRYTHNDHSFSQTDSCPCLTCSLDRWCHQSMFTDVEQETSTGLQESCEN